MTESHDSIMKDSVPEWIAKSLGRDKRTLEETVLDAAPLPEEYENTVGLYVICAQWNKVILPGTTVTPGSYEKFYPLFASLMSSHRREDTLFDMGILNVSNDEMSLLCGDDHVENVDNIVPCPPQQLPVLMLVIRKKSMDRPHIKFLSTLAADKILNMCKEGNANSITNATRQELAMELQSFGLSSSSTTTKLRSFPEPIRIFIAGDRMSVGKTSVCLGILGSLVRMGYSPEKLAYIKPATQSESPQLVQRYCEKLGIECVPVGPVVYYRGFTRAFLAGETESSEALLEKVGESVDGLAEGKEVVIIDGVGFPAVGSICGTDNASVALASSYPEVSGSGVTSRRPLGVLLVGGAGVGSAVDAFNLNATYFEMRRLPVLGAIFNKLSMEGFYSLENCKKQISLYFAQNQHQIRHGRKPFGFCPLFAKLQGKTVTDDVFEYIRVFEEHVNVPQLLESALHVQQNAATTSVAVPTTTSVKEPATKRPKISSKSRDEIENSAIQAGAVPSA